MEVVWIVLALVFSGTFAAAAFARRRGIAARSRLDLVAGGVDAVMVLAVAHEMAPWADVSTLLWLMPLTLLAAGTSGTLLAWSRLPAVRSDRSIGWSIAAGLIRLSVLASAGVLVFG